MRKQPSVGMQPGQKCRQTLGDRARGINTLTCHSSLHWLSPSEARQQGSPGAALQVTSSPRTQWAKKVMVGEEGWGWESGPLPSEEPETLPNDIPDVLLGDSALAGPCSGSRCALLNRWFCLQAITALMNRAEANGEHRSISYLKCLASTILY